MNETTNSVVILSHQKWLNNLVVIPAKAGIQR